MRFIYLLFLLINTTYAATSLEFVESLSVNKNAVDAYTHEKLNLCIYYSKSDVLIIHNDEYKPLLECLQKGIKQINSRVKKASTEKTLASFNDFNVKLQLSEKSSLLVLSDIRAEKSRNIVLTKKDVTNLVNALLKAEKVSKGLKVCPPVKDLDSREVSEK